MKEDTVSESAKVAKKPKRPRPARGDAFGILNPWGDIWTYDHFPTEKAAWAHLADFWGQPGFGPRDLTKFAVVPVKVTVSASKVSAQ